MLVALVQLVDQIPMLPCHGRRVRPPVYSDRLFLKALVIMIVKPLPRAHTLLAVLDQPTPEMQRLRALLGEQGRYPTRRTWERRLRAISDSLPAQIGYLGGYLVAVLDPWAAESPLAAMDSTVLRARGGVWHRKDREAGIVPTASQGGLLIYDRALANFFRFITAALSRLSEATCLAPTLVRLPRLTPAVNRRRDASPGGSQRHW